MCRSQRGISQLAQRSTALRLQRQWQPTAVVWLHPAHSREQAVENALTALMSRAPSESGKECMPLETRRRSSVRGHAIDRREDLQSASSSESPKRYSCQRAFTSGASQFVPAGSSGARFLSTASWEGVPVGRREIETSPTKLAKLTSHVLPGAILADRSLVNHRPRFHGPKTRGISSGSSTKGRSQRLFVLRFVI